jgi:hypothetical protein
MNWSIDWFITAGCFNIKPLFQPSYSAGSMPTPAHFVHIADDVFLPYHAGHAKMIAT